MRGMSQPRCDGCRFWDRAHRRPPEEPSDDDEGNCRRHPPVINPELVRLHAAAFAVSERSYEAAQEASGFAAWVFPVTMAYDWCGEHQPASA